jgi:Ca2+-binding RTX toxin-like protein
MAPWDSQRHASPGRQGGFVVFLAALVASMLVPAWAIASTASVDGGTQALHYVAAAGEANLLRVMQTPAEYEVEDLGVVFPGAAAPRCSPAVPYQVHCSFPVNSFVIELGDKGDAVMFASSGPATVNAGDGDDRIGGGSGGDTLNGEAGDDVFGAEPGGVDGRDSLSGGPGSDMADYGARSNPLQIDLDGVADDGEQGEGDNVKGDVEQVTGGAGPDRIVGNGARNRLRGAMGDDQLEGAELRDVLDGGAGNDTILARDGGPDVVRCGSDLDTAFVDEEDTVSSDCERVLGTPVAIVGPAVLPVSRDGTVPVQIRCAAADDKRCRGRLEITMTVWRRIPHRHRGKDAAAARHRRRRTNVKLARGSFAVPRGRTSRVPVRLNPEARRRVDRCGRLETQIAVVTGDAAHPLTVATRDVVLTAPSPASSTAARRPGEHPSVDRPACG